MQHLAVERGLSDHYQLLTQRNLETSAAWILSSQPGTTPGTVSSEMLSRYLAHRQAQGLSAASLRLILISWRIFYRFLMARGAVTADPTELLLPPRPDRPLPETMAEPRVTVLIDSIDPATPHGSRDRAMIELIYSSGLRAAEAVGARLEHLNLEEGFIRVTGKGAKTRLIPVGRAARDAITHPRAPGTSPAKTHRQPHLSGPSRRRSNNGQALADHQAESPGGWIGSKYLPAPAPAFFCHASSESWRRPAGYSGTPGPRRYRYDADLHPRGPSPPSRRAPTVSSQGKEMSYKHSQHSR
jgi:integrase